MDRLPTERVRRGASATTRYMTVNNIMTDVGVARVAQMVMCNALAIPPADGRDLLHDKDLDTTLARRSLGIRLRTGLAARAHVARRGDVCVTHGRAVATTCPIR